ncbi:MAG: aromatic amino acid transaminase [Burkholderiales bacterium]
MNASNTPSPLAAVPMAPKDPILGVTETYVADTNPNKVNLGVGIYYDDDGKVPVLECVRRAERQLVETAAPRAYLPIDGLAAYDSAVQTLVFGANCAAIKEKRIVTVQALGGTGGLKLGADFLRRIAPEAQVWISDPSWENHKALFEGAGFTVNSYPYYDATSHGLNFKGMIDSLRTLPAGSIVVLHVCCHNPTGADIASAQWQEVIAAVRSRGLVPFLDIAYQGFADSIDEDNLGVRLFAESNGPIFVSSSFSKSLSLYGERVGALSIVAESADEAARALSQLKRVIRTNYSNPPTHGGKAVAAVLASPELRDLWVKELGMMRDRIRAMREQFVAKLKVKAPKSDFSFVIQQRGMFSYSGLTKPQVDQLREKYSVYAIDTGRICVAALNSKNIDYVVDAVANVIA